MPTPCNCNDQYQHPCAQTPCITVENCDCPTKLQTKCVTFEGDDLPITGIKKNTIETTMWQQLDAYLGKLKTDLLNGMNLVNLGTVGARIYRGIDLLGRKEVRRINKTGNLITVTENTDDIVIGLDTIALQTVINNSLPIISPQIDYNAINVGEVTASDILKDELNNTFRFRKIKTQNKGVGVEILNVQTIVNDTIVIESSKLDTKTLDIKKSVDGTITIDIPTSFTSTDYYVNVNYDPTNLGLPQTGTASKPFKSLKNCVDKILNRPFSTPINQDNSIHPNPLINGGLPYNKWEVRSGLNDGAVRVVIQSYSITDENLAINRVEYFLEKEGSNSMIAVQGNLNLPYIFDMEALVIGVPKTALGQLPYEINCKLTGLGNIAFDVNNTFRKGYIKSFGYFSGVQTTEQPDCIFYLGNKNSNLNFQMGKNPSLLYSNLTLADGVTNIVRENTIMTGVLEADTIQTNYGAIHVLGRNAIFSESLFIQGNHKITATEQPIIMCDNGGAIYGDSGIIEIQRNYQHIHYSSIVTLSGTKVYLPSKKVNDIYLRNGGNFVYAGEITSQQNTSANQGGANSFVRLERTTTNANDVCNLNLIGGKISRLLYNHYIQLVYNNSTPIQNHSVNITNYTFNSSLQSNSAVNVINTDGTNFTAISGITIVNSFMNLVKAFSTTILANITNIPFNSVFYIGGGTLNTEKGFINSNVPVYTDNATAIANNASITSFYVDNNGFVKRVQ